jgi:hypothetical protein
MCLIQAQFSIYPPNNGMAPELTCVCLFSTHPPHYGMAPELTCVSVHNLGMLTLGGAAQLLIIEYDIFTRQGAHLSSLLVISSELVSRLLNP